MMKVTEQQFSFHLKPDLGKSWDRALKLFQEYGSYWQADVMNSLRHAVDKGKVEEVLETLEGHFTTHLGLQHPDARGQVDNALLSTNPTELMFQHIYENVLGLRKAKVVDHGN